VKITPPQFVNPPQLLSRKPPRRSSDFGNDASLPFSVPVVLHVKGNPPESLEAPFVSIFEGVADKKIVILYQDFENNKAGLYAYDQNAWHYIVAFTFVSNFVVNGGNCHVYVDPIAEQMPPSGSIIFNNGEPVASKTIPAGTGWWAAVEYNFVYQLQPATTATLGGVIVGNGLNVDGSGYLSTTIQKVAGVVPDGSHNVPLSVANITGAAPLASPNFMGTPSAPTPRKGTILPRSRRPHLLMRRSKMSRSSLPRPRHWAA